MKKYLLAATGVLLLAGSGVAWAQSAPDDQDHGPDQRRGRYEMMHRMHRYEQSAAFFRFRRGDAEMDIRCPATENVQACVAAAGSLMDKVTGMQQPKTQ